MGSYLMMLYVTVDQELALKSYFTQQGWPFKKPDLKVTTEELGGVVQNCLQDPEEPQRPTPALQEKHPSNKRKAPQKQRLPAKVARQVLPTVDNNVPSNEVQDSVETSTAYEDIVAKVEKKDEVNEYHVATSKTVNNIVIEGEDFIVKEELPDSNDESDNDTIDNDFDIAEESGVDSKVEPPEDIPETRTLDEPGTCSEILVGASGQKESSIKLVKAGSDFSEEERRTECRVCGIKCRTKRILERHILKHSTNVYACEVCGKTFQDKYYLNRHLKRHFSEYVCQYCGKTFSSSQSLKKHEDVTHSDNPQFKCNFCQKLCSTKADLQSHKALHDKQEKPFKSETCNKTFLHKSSLIRHNKQCKHNTEQKAQNFKCSTCDKTFKLARLLKQHKRVHSEPRFSCHGCGRNFIWRQCYKNHLKTCVK
ncbi:zinc finger protein 676-like isoform X3 [Mya arenaria]|uniref:zinc finger protein 676-like isoform X3 n=1 Tax=Mya arenaria TaxID=6604 RepID=UPI0022DFD94D|nr:zinc finger protein 676-like isoform X3 [Mya arenaria]